MNIKYTYAPDIRIHEIMLAVPRGFRVGAHVQLNGQTHWYVIRNRDDASVVVRSTPASDEVTPMTEMRARLHAAMDAKK